MKFSGVYDQEHIFNDLFAAIADYCDLELEEALQRCLDKMRQFLATVEVDEWSSDLLISMGTEGYKDYVLGKLLSILKALRAGMFESCVQAFLADAICTVYDSYIVTNMPPTKAYDSMGYPDTDAQRSITDDIQDIVEREKYRSWYNENVSYHYLITRDNITILDEEKATKSYCHKEWVGFDKCKIAFTVSDVDEKKFKHFIDTYQLKTLRDKKKDVTLEEEDKWPQVTTQTIKQNTKEKPLTKGIKIGDCYLVNYINVTIDFSPYEKVQMYVNNLKSPNNEKPGDRSDVCLITLNVRPAEGHEVLGNLRNYSYDDLCDALKTVAERLRKEAGLTLNMDSMKFTSIELNMTFVMPCQFDDLRYPLAYFQQHARSSYVASIYEWIRILDNGVKTNVCNGMVLKSKHGYLVVKLYDKKREIEQVDLAKVKKKDEKSNKEDKNDKAEIINLRDRSLVRLEYEITGKTMINQEFHTEYLNEFSQELIEKVYKKLTNQFFKETLDEHNKQAFKDMKEIFKNLETGKKGEWKATLVKRLMKTVIFYNGAPTALEPEDLGGVYRNNNLFNKHSQKYFDIIYELFKHDGWFDKTALHTYDIRSMFLVKTLLKKELEEKRIISYTVSKTD